MAGSARFTQKSHRRFPAISSKGLRQSHRGGAEEKEPRETLSGRRHGAAFPLPLWRLVSVSSSRSAASCLLLSSREAVQITKVSSRFEQRANCHHKQYFI